VRFLLCWPAGLPPLSYQWRFNGGNIAGATSSIFTKNNAQAIDAGSYTVTVSNRLSSLTSVVATLNVLFHRRWSSNPRAGPISPGTERHAQCVSHGTPPLNYRWQFNGTNLFATGATLIISDILEEDEGNYRVLVTNIAGAVTSAVAAVTVLVPPAMSLQPRVARISLGAPPLSVLWPLERRPSTTNGNSRAPTSRVPLVRIGFKQCPTAERG